MSHAHVARTGRHAATSWQCSPKTWHETLMEGPPFSEVQFHGMQLLLEERGCCTERRDLVRIAARCIVASCVAFQAGFKRHH